MKFLTCFYEMGSCNARRPALGFTLRCSKYTTFEHSKMNYRIPNTFMFRIPVPIQKNDFYIASTQSKKKLLDSLLFKTRMEVDVRLNSVPLGRSGGRQSKEVPKELVDG